MTGRLDLEELKKLADKATRGPWRAFQACEEIWHHHAVREVRAIDYGRVIEIHPEINALPRGADHYECQIKGWANVTFIAATREAVPALIAEVERLRLIEEEAARLRAEVERLREALKPFADLRDGGYAHDAVVKIYVNGSLEAVYDNCILHRARAAMEGK